MAFVWFYLKYRRKAVGVFFLFVLIFFAVFYLYHLPLEAVLYPAGVCTAAGVLFLIFDIRKSFQKHKRLESLLGFHGRLTDAFPEPDCQDDADYQKLFCQISEEKLAWENQMNRRYEEMVEYYTIWAHQIKTPIAAMKLTLQNEDTALSRRLSEELFRIEQYVEMVLMFLRLDSDTTDYVFRKYSLDDIIKQAIRKFSSQFIGKKLRLEYEPVEYSVVTDEKWLLFVIEQVLSNAVKYTPSGGTISIHGEGEKTLCIRDTGIGIAPEDLPRIFEKGYTGYNGREDKKASGIGLYLCRRICSNLGCAISANSSLDSGTAIRIRFDQKKQRPE